MTKQGQRTRTRSSGARAPSPSRSRRSYDQYCPAARALDLVGERWTILLVRELLLGPKRYTDLLDGLPGIGPNVLAERLRHLQGAGIVRRRELPPPTAVTVYELTETGERLRGVVAELTRWGLGFLGAPRAGDRFHLSWLLRSLEATARPDAARGVKETYEFRIGGETFHVDIDDGNVAVRQGPARSPACVFTADLATFTAVGARRMMPEDAIASGRAFFEGDAEAGRRSIEILGPHLGSLGGPGGILAAARLRLHPAAAQGVDESYEFRVDGESFHVRVEGGEADVAAGPAEDPAVVIATDLDTLLALGSGLSATEAMEQGRVRLEGDAQAARRAWAVVDVPQTR